MVVMVGMKGVVDMRPGFLLLPWLLLEIDLRGCGFGAWAPADDELVDRGPSVSAAFRTLSGIWGRRRGRAVEVEATAVFSSSDSLLSSALKEERKTCWIFGQDKNGDDDLPG